MAIVIEEKSRCDFLRLGARSLLGAATIAAPPSPGPGRFSWFAITCVAGISGEGLVPGGHDLWLPTLRWVAESKPN